MQQHFTSYINELVQFCLTFEKEIGKINQET